MRARSRHYVALTALLFLGGCSDDPAQPDPVVCDPELSSVTANTREDGKALLRLAQQVGLPCRLAQPLVAAADAEGLRDARHC